MPKKLKLNLDNLKVSSFVTSLGNDQRKVRGGVEWTDFATCSCDGGCQPKTDFETCLSCENTCAVCSDPLACTFNTDCTLDPRICKTAAC